MNRQILSILILALVAAAGGGGYYYYDLQTRQTLPAGFASSNGRIEATEVDIATKVSARIEEILVAEGELVHEGQTLARMDIAETQATLRALEAQSQQASQARDQASHVVEQRRGDLGLAAKNQKRSKTLFDKGYATGQKLDQMNTARITTQAALSAAESSLAATESAIRAADAEVDRLRRQVADGTLVAPRSGRVLYRLAEPGEVLGAGGKVLTLLDLSDVYMTVFLPSAIAGRLAIGADARLVLEPIPERAIPGKVSFISSRAQFTPKQVETQSERDRMMFRVKVRVPAELVQRFIAQVKTGITGMAYIRLDPEPGWPAWLESDLTQTAAQ